MYDHAYQANEFGLESWFLKERESIIRVTFKEDFSRSYGNLVKKSLEIRRKVMSTLLK